MERIAAAGHNYIHLMLSFMNKLESKLPASSACTNTSEHPL